MKRGLWFYLLTPVVRFLDARSTRLIRNGSSREKAVAACRLELRAVKLRRYFLERRAARLERDL